MRPKLVGVTDSIEKLTFSCSKSTIDENKVFV